MDDWDQKITNVLLDNARLTYRQIAQRVGVSVGTVIRRVKEMEKTGLIRKYSALLDYSKTDYAVEVAVSIRVHKGQFDKLYEKLQHHPSVSALYDVTGDYDSLVLARFKSVRSLNDFLKKVQKWDFVEKTYTQTILNTVKEEETRL